MGMSKALFIASLSLAALAALLCFAAGCGGKKPRSGPAAPAEAKFQIPPAEERIEIPGIPALAEGASNLAGPRESLPMPKFAARAGIDFPADRFNVIFENSPSAQALAEYLSGDAEGEGANAAFEKDNRPLVSHPYFKMVSVNLAAKYGLEIDRRVFFRGVNFVTYKAKDIDDAAKLDAIMMKVLTENRGLVAEVGYDFYVSVFAPIGGYVYYETAGEPAQPGDSPAGHKFLPGFLKPESAQEVNRTVSAPPDDPMHLNKNGTQGGTWANWRVGAVDGKAWDKTTGSASVIVADIDTGVRYTHQDLAANMIVPADTPPYNEPGVLTDVVNKDNDPMDDHYHGTMVAGCIGAVGNNGLGLAGINHTVTILPIKVLNSGGSGTYSGVAEGMLLANYLGAHIQNLSLGGPFPERTIQLAVKQCYEDGKLILIAAGNSYTDAPLYPGYYPECVAVGATTLVNDSNNQDFSLVDDALPIDTRYDARAGFSNYGDWVDIAAPGVEVRTTHITADNAYVASVAGTSFATPYTAGCAALLWAYISQFETPTALQVRELLQGSARPMEKLNNGVNPRGFRDNDSNGTVRFVDVNAALELYESGAGIAYEIEWDNPADGATVTGDTEIRISISGGTGNVVKVEFETPTRFLGATDVLDEGFYKFDWDTTFEFNREMRLRAIVITDEGRITRSTINVTPENARAAIPLQEDFTGVADNEIPTDWYHFDGNKGTGSTKWGADTSQFGAESPSLHSSGAAANYVARSNDWLYMPVIDLTNQASATLSFDRRYRMGSNGAIYFCITTDDRNLAIWDFTSTTLQDWDNFSISLSPWAGREIRAYWVLIASSGSGPGMWIDDVEVTGAEGTPPSIQIVSPANGASVSGAVPIELEIENVERIRVYAQPPDFGGYLAYDTQAADTEFSFDWDSRYVYSGGALLTIMAFDSDAEDGLMQVAYVALNAVIESRDPRWNDSFEDIAELGGMSGGALDGDWYVWGGGADMWRVTGESAADGDFSAKFGPEDDSDYGNGASGRLYGPFHDPGDAEHPFLRLSQKLDLGTGDVARIVLVRYDGLDESEVIIGEYRSDIADWTEQYFDLTFAEGGEFRILFKFDANSDGSAGKGWFIDDYEVFIAGARITSIVDPSGAPGKTVTVNGNYFGPLQETSTITFAKEGGGRTSPAVNVWGDNAIEVVVPADAVSGNVVVNVQGYDSNGYYFGVALVPPVLKGVNPIN